MNEIACVVCSDTIKKLNDAQIMEVSFQQSCQKLAGSVNAKEELQEREHPHQQHVLGSSYQHHLCLRIFWVVHCAFNTMHQLRDAFISHNLQGHQMRQLHMTTINTEGYGEDVSMEGSSDNFMFYLGPTYTIRQLKR